MNKDLYGKNYPIPQSILNNLVKYKSNETINNLLNTKTISYSLLKKLKHRMEHNEKNVLGGDIFYNWINQTLQIDRSGLDVSKDAKLEAGVTNSHIKPHEKDDLRTMNRPSKEHGKSIDDIKITESLKRINDLISKII